MLFQGPVIHLFSATELERLVCGTPLLDFGALQRAARYDGYTADSQVRCCRLDAPSGRIECWPACPALWCGRRSAARQGIHSS